ncbi:ATP-binding cassette domain-containing protein [Arenibacter sp. GZD96]|uniref:ABC transporter ATP-binding protein n=1 Tax=Aurantibrevibacter litoralis TaxID=3106030 RepID=UPI002AFE8B13|nr:ATP-binding cassette domain-containing protein [Arenibacter sp. GZD-96]MEA1785117.1 ATP-binding cassette domain-containing protein [Arenibacter sp. GZD-96]
MTDSSPGHCAVYVKNNADTASLISELKRGTGFNGLSEQKVALFSKAVLEQYVVEEDRHDQKIITRNTSQSLLSMSSGEQKKALLHHLLETSPDVIIVENAFDNLDVDAQKFLREKLYSISKEVRIIQIMSRKEDRLDFITSMVAWDNNRIRKLEVREATTWNSNTKASPFQGSIPEPLRPHASEQKTLILFKKVSVSYGSKSVLRDIDWEVKSGEFWQLSGKNGSGKTTILTMIIGDNPKAYGQKIYIFGKKKGSGESVWDIKNRIGYFTPSMTDKFTGYHTVEFMLLSGFFDSIGLYCTPTERQYRLAKEWLNLIGLWPLKDMQFHSLSAGQQRLIMVTRAMIKHPELLILDEPTAGLDDESAALFVTLINKISKESTMTIIFVSHRFEAGLHPQFSYELIPTNKGSTGRVIKNNKDDLY